MNVLCGITSTHLKTSAQLVNTAVMGAMNAGMPASIDAVILSFLSVRSPCPWYAKLTPWYSIKSREGERVVWS